MKAKSPTSDASTARAGCSPFAPRGRGRPDCQDPATGQVLFQAFVPKLVNAHCRHGAHTPPHAPRFHLRPVDAQYFSISRSGPCWDTSCRAARWRVYSRRVAGIELELLVILES